MTIVRKSGGTQKVRFLWGAVSWSVMRGAPSDKRDFIDHLLLGVKGGLSAPRAPKAVSAFESAC